MERVLPRHMQIIYDIVEFLGFSLLESNDVDVVVNLESVSNYPGVVLCLISTRHCVTSQLLSAM